MSEFRVLTLNCWGLKYVAKDRIERINAIAARFAQSNHDLIACQELWVYSDYLLVRNSCSSLLPYSKFFYSGALGSGLVFFSKYPILQTHCHPYSLNGCPLDVAAGDWFVGKAVVSILIQHPILGPTQIFNTHLFAKGGEDGAEHKRAHRLVNAWQFSQLVKQAAERGRHVIALGDFNSTPQTLPMTLTLEHTGLSDAWTSTHPDSAVRHPNISSPREAIAQLGVTADSPLNSYSTGKRLEPYARRNGGKRLDYILFRSPLLRCKQCSVVMTENVPGHGFSFSDHFGLEATFSFDASMLEQQSISSHISLDGIASDTISKTMFALTECLRFSRQRAYKELLIFAFCLFLLFVVVVGSSWFPKSWINPIVILFTIFLSWLATTLLYSGFIYGRWESNALMNVVEELEILQQARQVHSAHPNGLVNGFQ